MSVARRQLYRSQMSAEEASEFIKRHQSVMGLTQIAEERDAARAAIADAERAMQTGSADAKAFRAAKRQRQDALEALERLEWAEKAALEHEQAQQHQAKLDKLRDAQRGAAEGHQRAGTCAARLAEISTELVNLAKELAAAQEKVQLGVNHEVYAMREQLIQRPTVQPRVSIDRDALTLALRAVRELCKIAGMHPAAADQQAAQRRL